MLTETQFKIIMILFDDKGHAGWELAEILGKEESNINSLLKKLDARDIVKDGPRRESHRPKKIKSKKSENVKKSVELKKREGDYKEVPYYLVKDLNTFGTIVKEMVATNEIYDLGFPWRIIRSSNYVRAIRDIFKEDYFEYMANLSKDNTRLHTCPISIVQVERVFCCGFKELHLLNFNKEDDGINDRVVSKKLLSALEIWWLRFNLTMYCSQDPINYDEIRKILSDDALNDYVLGDDIMEVIHKYPTGKKITYCTKELAKEAFWLRK